MKIVYGRKSWVPDHCPQCDEPLCERPSSDGGTIGLITALFNYTYNSYHREYIKDDFWKMKRWCGVCSKCAMKEVMEAASRNNFLDLIPKKEQVFKPIQFKLS